MSTVVLCPFCTTGKLKAPDRPFFSELLIISHFSPHLCHSFEGRWTQEWIPILFKDLISENKGSKRKLNNKLHRNMEEKQKGNHKARLQMGKGLHIFHPKLQNWFSLLQLSDENCTIFFAEQLCPLVSTQCLGQTFLHRQMH